MTRLTPDSQNCDSIIAALKADRNYLTALYHAWLSQMCLRYAYCDGLPRSLSPGTSLPSTQNHGLSETLINQSPRLYFAWSYVERSLSLYWPSTALTLYFWPRARNKTADDLSTAEIQRCMMGPIDLKRLMISTWPFWSDIRIPGTIDLLVWQPFLSTRHEGQLLNSGRDVLPCLCNALPFLLVFTHSFVLVIDVSSIE